MTSLVDVLQLGGTWELVEKLWKRFLLTASHMNITVACSRDEVLINFAIFPEFLEFTSDVPPWPDCSFSSITLNGMFPRILERVVNCMRPHRQFGVELDERCSFTWVFVRTWIKKEFVREAVAVIDRYYGDASSELVIKGKFACANGIGALLISLSGGTHTLVERYEEYFGSGYTKVPAGYPRLMWNSRNVVSKKLHLLCLLTRIPFQWLKSLWNVWRGQSIVTGCNTGKPTGWLLRQMTCHCSAILTSSVISSGCGCSLLSF